MIVEILSLILFYNSAYPLSTEFQIQYSFSLLFRYHDLDIVFLLKIKSV